MTAIVHDKLKFVESVEKAGFTYEQAKILAESIVELSSHDNFVTNREFQVGIKEIELKIAETKAVIAALLLKLVH